MNKSNTSIVIIENDTLLLQTGLTSRQFAHAKMGQYITEPGIIVSPTQKDNYTTEDFRFTESKTITSQKGDEIVLYFNGIKGKTLLSVLEENSDTQENLVILENLNMCLEWSFKNNILISNCGPLGIIILDNKSFLFLPVALFERSIFAQEEAISSSVYGCWINASLSHIDGWRFSLSSYIYAILSGDKPYKELNSEKRVEDYYDNYFLPLDLSKEPNNEESKSLAKTINKNLSLTKESHTRIKPVKVTKKTPLKDSFVSSIPLPKKIDYTENTTTTEKCEQIKTTFLEKQLKQIQKRRFFRKNKTSLTICSAVLIVIGLVATSIINSYQSKPTTEGMTALEVTETFYTAFSSLNNELLDSCGDSKAIKNYSDVAATLFVSGKMREAYEQTVSFLPPSQWIGTHEPTELSVFGLTNLKIHQSDPETLPPVFEDTATLEASFYTIMSQGPDQYEVTKNKDLITLEYGKKYWQIIKIESDTQAILIDGARFNQDIKTGRETIQSNETIELHEQGIALTQSLRDTYPWLPTVQEVEKNIAHIPTHLLTKKITIH